MEFLILLGLVASVGVWWWFFSWVSGYRLWHPLWVAFSMTAGAILFTGAGSIGLVLSRHAQFRDGSAWSGSVIWWEVVVGLILGFAAVYFWRSGVREISAERVRE